MIRESLKKDYNLLLESIENAFTKSMEITDNIHIYLGENFDILNKIYTFEKELLILNVINLSLKDSMCMLKKEILEENDKVIYLTSQDSDIIIN